MKPKRIDSARLLFALPAALMLLSLPAMAAQRPPGQTVYVGCSKVDVGIFESDAPIQSAEDAELAQLFDPAALPTTDTSCYQENWPQKRLKILRPYDGASFPRNIVAPKIRWADRVNNLWLLSLTAPGWAAPLRVVTADREWRPDSATWEALKSSGTGGWIQVELRGCVVEEGKRRGGDVYVDRSRFRVSTYPADPLIVYRLVSPLFHGYKTPDVCYRDITDFEQHMFLPSKGKYCTNCHVFPNVPNPGTEDLTLAIAARESFHNLRLLGLYEFGSRASKTLAINSFFMSWHPTGRCIAVTGGDSVTVKMPITLETQEFYVNVADILIVDADTFSVSPLPGACEPDYMESFPAWSPDGETIVFARAKELPLPAIPPVKYELYRVPYNDGLGGEATAIVGAGGDGTSNFAPRYSPDGKWIVFNKADDASLVEPTADLYIVSTAEGAVPRPLECNVPYAMDSHHSWSSNSRWLLFASKRDDGVFARIYLTEIDEDGHASAPVELPTLEDPMMCYNVPEFLRYRPDIDAEDIVRKVSSVSD